MSFRYQIILFQIILTLLIVAIIAALTVAWNNREYNLGRIKISSKQLDTFSELLLTVNHLESDLSNVLLLSSLNNQRIIQLQNRIGLQINSLRQSISEEQKWLEDSPEQDKEKNEINVVELLERLNLDTKILLEKIFISYQNQQREEIEGIVKYINLNLLSSIKINVITGIIDQKAEIQEASKKLYFKHMLFLILFLIISLLLLCYLLGYSVYNATKHITKEHISQQNKLEDIVSARTTELTEANEKLKQIDTMRGRFLADISHEIKTPITAIRGETEIRLRKTGHPESEYRDTLVRVKLLSDNISALIDDLLFVARSEKDAVHFEFKKNNIDGIILSAVNNYRIIAKDKKIDLEVEWPNQSVELYMDTFRIKQALNIILDNALKYSFPGNNIVVSISTDDDFVNIAVRNNGEKIDSEEIPYIFERFYRGTNNSKQSGSGLGLPIAKWIVEKHIGSICIESDQGITVVTMKLPRQINMPSTSIGLLAVN